MSKGFWTKLNKPIFVLAPMADVTDAAFRRLIAKYGKPDVTWTEFVSADGLVLAPEEGKKKLLLDLVYTESERPIVAQFFTSSPDNMRKAAELARELGFDGIDINMGCPVKKVLNQKSCSALIKTPELAKEIIKAAKEGAKDIPVSVKTRIGFNKNEIETWIPQVLEMEPAVLTVHLRTVREMSKVPAHWECMKRIVEIRDEMGSSTLIFGNGDVKDIEEAKQRVRETGCDGVMLGRAIFGNPWLFKGKIPSIEEKLRVLIEHIELFEELLGEMKSFAIMKKHFKAYVNGFDGAAELRASLMECENALEVKDKIENFIK
jgi:nifR3 family TIM-barrel protein